MEKHLPREEVNRVLNEARSIVYQTQKPFIINGRLVLASSLEEAKSRLQG